MNFKEFRLEINGLIILDDCVDMFLVNDIYIYVWFCNKRIGIVYYLKCIFLKYRYEYMLIRWIIF